MLVGARIISWGSQRCKFVGARLFLGLAVAQMCGDAIAWGSHSNDEADLWGPGYSWGSQQLGFAY